MQVSRGFPLRQRRVVRPALLFCCLLLPKLSTCATIDVEYAAPPLTESVISISGEITEGDTEAFKSAVKAANDAGKLVTSIRLAAI